MKNDRVSDCITRNVVTIGPESTLPEAARLMKEKGFRRLPVVKGSKLVGIVSSSDVHEAEPSDATSLSVWEIAYLLSQLRIESIMTKDPVTVREDATLGEVARIMLDKKIGGLPVVNDVDQLIGIVTESDIFRLVAENW